MPGESEWGINIVLFGPPGAGKGTQAQRLQSTLGLPVIVSGDIFRAMRRDDTPLGREVRDILDRGAYVPDALTIEVVLGRLRQTDASGGFILDGFPRTDTQALALDDFLTAKAQKVDVALHVTAPTAVLEYRLTSRVICPQCNTIYNLISKPPQRDMICDLDGSTLERRSDEQLETIRQRLLTHQTETEPLIDYYRRQGGLIEIDGSRPMAEVEAEIDNALGIHVV